jgi:hypothetical protein
MVTKRIARARLRYNGTYMTRSFFFLPIFVSRLPQDLGPRPVLSGIVSDVGREMETVSLSMTR